MKTFEPIGTKIDLETSSGEMCCIDGESMLMAALENPCLQN